jgi:hypothetical protein
MDELGICMLCGHDCKQWNKFEKIAKDPRYHSAAFEVFQKPVLIDSSKKPWWVTYTEPHVDAEVKLIRLTRDARDRFNQHRLRYGKVRAIDVQRWIKAESRITKFLKKRDSITVKAEDIGSGEAIKKCCEYIGVDFQPTMMEYWKKKHHGTISNIIAWTPVKTYHGYPIDEKWKTGKAFYEKHGYCVNIPKSRHLLKDTDNATIKKEGGFKLNKDLGYA